MFDFDVELNTRSGSLEAHFFVMFRAFTSAKGQRQDEAPEEEQGEGFWLQPTKPLCQTTPSESESSLRGHCWDAQKMLPKQVHLE